VIQPPGGDRLDGADECDRPEPESAPPDETEAVVAEPLEEVREAAGAVIGSLKRLLEATERVVADPASFDQAVAGGKGLLDAFTSGFVTESNRPGASAGEADHTAS